MPVQQSRRGLCDRIITIIIVWLSDNVHGVRHHQLTGRGGGGRRRESTARRSHSNFRSFRPRESQPAESSLRPSRYCCWLRQIPSPRRARTACNENVYTIAGPYGVVVSVEEETKGRRDLAANVLLCGRTDKNQWRVEAFRATEPTYFYLHTPSTPCASYENGQRNTCSKTACVFKRIRFAQKCVRNTIVFPKITA